MHCGRLECSANPARTAFHQMQYDSNYHTQVVYQRSDIVDNSALRKYCKKFALCCSNSGDECEIKLYPSSCLNSVRDTLENEYDMRWGRGSQDAHKTHDVHTHARSNL